MIPRPVDSCCHYKATFEVNVCSLEHLLNMSTVLLQSLEMACDCEMETKYVLDGEHLAWSPGGSIISAAEDDEEMPDVASWYHESSFATKQNTIFSRLTNINGSGPKDHLAERSSRWADHGQNAGPDNFRTEDIPAEVVKKEDREQNTDYEHEGVAERLSSLKGQTKIPQAGQQLHSRFIFAEAQTQPPTPQKTPDSTKTDLYKSRPQQYPPEPDQTESSGRSQRHQAAILVCILLPVLGFVYGHGYVDAWLCSSNARRSKMRVLVYSYTMVVLMAVTLTLVMVIQ